MKHKKKKYKTYDPFWKLAAVHYVHNNKKKYYRNNQKKINLLDNEE